MIDKDNSLFLTYFSNVTTLFQAGLNLLSSSMQEVPLLSFPIYTEVWNRLVQLLFDYLRDHISTIAYNAVKSSTEIANHTLQLSVSLVI